MRYWSLQKKKTLKLYHEYKDKLDNTDALLGRKNSSALGFSNQSAFTLPSLLDDPNNTKVILKTNSMVLAKTFRIY